MQIENVTVSADYCFGDAPLKLSNLSKVNFIFAPNGSGKTTISNKLAEQPTAMADRENWSVAPTNLSIRVFNEAYRSRVLSEHVGGIFTMGAESKAVNDQIQALTENTRTQRNEIGQLTREIGAEDGPRGAHGLLGDIATARLAARDSVFEAHKAAPKAVAEVVFKGFRNNREKFFNEALKRSKGEYPEPTDVTYASLETRVSVLQGHKQRRSPLPSITINSLISADEIIDVGSTAVANGTGDFAKFIQHLANDDWVSEGRRFLNDAEGVCPFCQQATPDNLPDQIAEYFAGGFDIALQRARQIHSSVFAKADGLRGEISALEIALRRDDEVDDNRFSTLISSLRRATDLLVSLVHEKKQHPTKSVTVSDVDDLVEELSLLTDLENRAIATHNQLIADSTVETHRLTEDGWELFLSGVDVKTAIKRFNGIKKHKEARIAAIQEKIAECERAAEEDGKSIATLRESISNTAEVSERINKLLTVMGFHRFHLDVTDEVTGGYRICRKDGESAFSSLSEGEKSFICFAYFWESLWGSELSGTSPEDVVAVLDDPISSLDSDTLFIVAAHVRHAAQLAVEGKTNLRQLVVLTHNTQFHHEASYSSTSFSKVDRHFYRLVKDLGGTTSVKDDWNKSKIRGTYSLLWDSVVEAAKSDDESSLVQVGVYNIVRRILEGYFKTVGNLKDYQRPGNMTPTEERVISMFHIWASSGSHTIADDIDQTVDVGGTRRFLQLFRRYFDLENHSAHFDMMVEASGGAELTQPGGIFAPHV